MEAREEDWAALLLRSLEEVALPRTADKVRSTAHLGTRAEVWEACSVESSAETNPATAADLTRMATLTISQPVAPIKDKHHPHHTSQVDRAATNPRAAVTILRASSRANSRASSRATDTTSRSMDNNHIMGNNSTTLVPRRTTTVDHPVNNIPLTTNTAVVMAMANKAILRHLQDHRADMAIKAAMPLSNHTAVGCKVKVDIKHTGRRVVTMEVNKAIMAVIHSHRTRNGGSLWSAARW